MPSWVAGIEPIAARKLSPPRIRLVEVRLFLAGLRLVRLLAGFRFTLLFVVRLRFLGIVLTFLFFVVLFFRFLRLDGLITKISRLM
jgi:hypothetical protein